MPHIGSVMCKSMPSRNVPMMPLNFTYLKLGGGGFWWKQTLWSMNCVASTRRKLFAASSFISAAHFGQRFAAHSSSTRSTVAEGS